MVIRSTGTGKFYGMQSVLQVGIVLVLYRDYGRENGNYDSILG